MVERVLVYAPEVRIIVLTAGGKQYDLSRDVVSGRVSRKRDAVSTASFTLDNRNSKYTGKLSRMDRVVISLKKTRWVQVFAGYLTEVPYIDMYPTTVNISAECTLKRLMHTWWDPGLQKSLELLQQGRNAQTGTDDFADGSAAKVMTDLLVKVGGWKPSDIFISKIPSAFTKLANKFFDSSSSDTDIYQQLQSAMGADGVVAGANISSGSNGSIDGDSITKGMGPPGLEPFLHAIRERESSGRYNLHDQSKYTGAFQFGVEEWANYGGYRYPWQAPKDVQDRKATEWFTNFWNKYHDWKKCAAAHFGGPGVANHPEKWGRSDGGMNIRQYVHDVVDVKMPKYAARMVTTENTPVKTPTTTTGLDGTAGTSKGGTALMDGTDSTQQTTNGKINIDKVIAQAKTVLGYPYLMGNASGGMNGSTNGHYDCSGLTSMAYGKAAGINIGRSASNQFNNMADARVSRDNILPGDLIFYMYGRKRPADHVAMYIGGGQMIEASRSAGKVRIGAARFDSCVGISRPANSKVTQNKINAPFGDSALTGVDGASGTGVDPAVRALFNWERVVGGSLGDSRISPLLSGEKSLINDVNLLSSIKPIAQASMRSFMSAPTGAFYAVFPDYFGLWGTKPALFVEDVELLDFKITLSDAPITTHVFSFGDVFGDGFDGINLQEYLNGGSYVNVFQEYVFDDLIRGSDKLGSPEDFVKLFGVRPHRIENSVIKNRMLEYTQALYTFMDKWSQQFRTNIQIGFTPEAWPGMRMKVNSMDVTVFIEEVTHSWSYDSGFDTQLTISSPTAGDNSPVSDLMMKTF